VINYSFSLVRLNHFRVVRWTTN